MSSLGGSTVSSSYDRLLALPGGGGDGTNLVSLTDGNATTTFALRLSTTDISVPATGKVYLDGGNNSYITESSNGTIDFIADGKTVLTLNKGGTSELRTNALRVQDENAEDSSDSALFFRAQAEINGIYTVHYGPIIGGSNYGNDILLLGRHDSSTDTNVVLNAKVGIGTHGTYPTGPQADFHVMPTSYFESNVGIGTNSPSYQFHVYKAGADAIAAITSTDNDAVLRINSGDVDDHSMIYFGNETEGGTGSLGRIYYNHHATPADQKMIFNVGDEASVTAMTIKGDGKIGIGTTVPTGKLHVSGSFFMAGTPIIERTGLVIDGGVLDVLSTQGPYVTVASETSTTDDLDFITIDGTTPPEGTMLYLTRSGSHVITMRTGTHGSVTDGVTAIQCLWTEEKGEAPTLGTELIMNSAYGTVQLLYSDADRWVVMNPGNTRINF